MNRDMTVLNADGTPGTKRRIFSAVRNPAVIAAVLLTALRFLMTGGLFITFMPDSQ